MERNKKKIFLGIAVSITLLIIIGLVMNQRRAEVGRDSSISGNLNGGGGGSSALYPVNLDDPQHRMGRSHYVFVAKINKEVSQIPRDYGAPYTQFEAEVIYNLKGSLKGKVIVERSSDPEFGDFLGLPKPGNAYLMATRDTNKRGMYTISSHPSGLALVSKDASLSRAELQALAKENNSVKRLQDAYKDEILSRGEAEAGTDYNSYRSLTKEQKEALENQEYLSEFWSDQLKPQQPEEPEEPAEQPRQYYGY